MWYRKMRERKQGSMIMVIKDEIRGLVAVEDGIIWHGQERTEIL